MNKNAYKMPKELADQIQEDSRLFIMNNGFRKCFRRLEDADNCTIYFAKAYLKDEAYNLEAIKSNWERITEDISQTYGYNHNVRAFKICNQTLIREIFKLMVKDKFKDSILKNKQLRNAIETEIGEFLYHDIPIRGYANGELKDFETKPLMVVRAIFNRRIVKLFLEDELKPYFLATEDEEIRDSDCELSDEELTEYISNYLEENRFKSYNMYDIARITRVPVGQASKILGYLGRCNDTISEVRKQSKHRRYKYCPELKLINNGKRDRKDMIAKVAYDITPSCIGISAENLREKIVKYFCSGDNTMIRRIIHALDESGLLNATQKGRSVIYTKQEKTRERMKAWKKLCKFI